jgi:hypothetical protein
MSKLDLKQMEARDVEWEAPQGRRANRIRDSGFRGGNEEHPLSSFCGRSCPAGFGIQDSGFGIQETQLRSQDKEEMTVRLVLAPNARKNDWLMLRCS